MSPKKWFRTIMRRKKKENKSTQQEKVESPAEPLEESNSIPVEAPVINRAVPTRLIEDIAATRIQNAFRSFMARRTTIHHLRGTEKFEALIQDHLAREQTETALSYIHSWCRIQDQIRARRLCMVTEARIKQKKLENQLKLEAKIHELEVEWNCGSETMEEILSRIHQREEAAVKRERAMAYAFSHQGLDDENAVETQLQPVLWASLFQSWQRELGLELDGAMGGGPPMGNSDPGSAAKAKKPNGQKQNKSDKVTTITTDLTDGGSTPAMANGNETGKAKENNTTGLSK